MPDYNSIKCCVCGVNWDDHSAESPECGNKKPVFEDSDADLARVVAVNGVSLNGQARESLYNTIQPAPDSSSSEAAWDIAIDTFTIYSRAKNLDENITRKVIEMFNERDKFGTKKYKVRLKLFDGRDTRIDLMQELADAYVYCVKLFSEANHFFYGDKIIVEKTDKNDHIIDDIRKLTSKFSNVFIESLFSLAELIEKDKDFKISG